MARAPAGPEHELGERAEVGVVVEMDGQADPSLEFVAEVVADPAGKDRGADTEARLVDRTSQGDAGSEHAVPRHGSVVEHGIDHRHRVLQPLAGVVVDVGQGLALGEDGERQVGERHAHRAVVELDTEHAAGRGVEREQDGRPTRADGEAPMQAGLVVVGVGTLDDQPAGLELADQARHGRACETRLAGDVRATHRAVFADDVEHTQPVELAQRTERTTKPLLRHGADSLRRR